jgi:hypothetical protein
MKRAGCHDDSFGQGDCEAGRKGHGLGERVQWLRERKKEMTTCQPAPPHPLTTKTGEKKDTYVTSRMLFMYVCSMYVCLLFVCLFVVCLFVCLFVCVQETGTHKNRNFCFFLVFIAFCILAFPPSFHLHSLFHLSSPRPVCSHQTSLSFSDENNLILLAVIFLVQHKHSTTQPSKQPSNNISNTGHITHTQDTIQPNTQHTHNDQTAQEVQPYWDASDIRVPPPTAHHDRDPRCLGCCLDPKSALNPGAGEPGLGQHGGQHSDPCPWRTHLRRAARDCGCGDD